MNIHYSTMEYEQTLWENGIYLHLLKGKYNIELNRKKIKSDFQITCS